MAGNPVSPVVKVLRQGDGPTKADPFTIVIVANPALEAPWHSGTFVVDPITGNEPSFDLCAQYIQDALFGNLPNQREVFLGDPVIEPHVRLVSLFVPGLLAEDANALVAQDGVSNLLVARRSVFVPFLTRYALQADVAYAVSASDLHDRASAWFTSDDDARPGAPFTLDGVTRYHRHFNLIPGTVAIHRNSRSLTAVHEFGHALSSYTNGSVVDLYVDSSAGLNNKRGRPIPPDFANYSGISMATDAARDGLGYPAGWQSYHCELIDATLPAIMDNYWLAASGVPEHCLHDRITRQFLRERLLARISR
ncbi:MAG: hypothetical protein HYS12_16660 [Planctomycetes bacterium]|nr:hypothetical protein [Planctomycetota bacterium]